jgi:hypothetical protein
LPAVWPTSLPAGSARRRGRPGRSGCGGGAAACPCPCCARAPDRKGGGGLTAQQTKASAREGIELAGNKRRDARWTVRVAGYLVQHDVCVAREVRWAVREVLQEVPRRHKAHDAAGGVAPDPVAHPVPHHLPKRLPAQLPRHMPCQRDGREALRLSHDHAHPLATRPRGGDQELRHHGALAAARLPLDARHRVSRHRRHNGRLLRVDRQLLRPVAGRRRRRYRRAALLVLRRLGAAGVGPAKACHSCGRHNADSGGGFAQQVLGVEPGKGSSVPREQFARRGGAGPEVGKETAREESGGVRHGPAEPARLVLGAILFVRDWREKRGTGEERRGMGL